MNSHNNYSDLLRENIWGDFQDRLSQVTGLSLQTFDIKCSPMGKVYNPKMICEFLKRSKKGHKQCLECCDKNLSNCLTSNQSITFTCYAGLTNFVVPVNINNDQIGAVLGGRILTKVFGNMQYEEISREYNVKLDEIIDLYKNIKLDTFSNLEVASNFVYNSAKFFSNNTKMKGDLDDRLSVVNSLLDLNLSLNTVSLPSDYGTLILSALADVFQIPTSSLMLWDRDEKIFKTKAVIGEQKESLRNFNKDFKELVFDIYERKSPIIIKNNEDLKLLGFGNKVKSFSALPLVYNNCVTGFVIFINKVLTDSELEVFISFCDHIAIGLKNINIRERFNQAMMELSILTELSSKINSILDLDHLLKMILDKSAELVKAERASLMLLDEEAKKLAFKVAMGVHEKVVNQIRYVPEGSISDKVVKLGEPLLVKDVEKELDIKHEKYIDYRSKSFISLPLRINGRVLGVINITDKINGEVFDENDLRLLKRMSTCATIAIERSEYYEESKKLKMLSITDGLTGLFNRRYFQEQIETEIGRSNRFLHPVSLIILDVDDFKYYNDRNGHLAGDEVLRNISSVLNITTRSIDIATRFGGEEFAIILPGTNKEGALIIAEKIRREVEKTNFTYQKFQPQRKLTVSLGVATYPEDADTTMNLINNTDKALYAAKSEGKNQVVDITDKANS